MAHQLIGTQPGEVILAGTATQGKGFGLGDRYTDQAGREFVYAQASAAITANFVCIITEAYVATMVTTTNGLFGTALGVCTSLDALATGDQAWFQVKGPIAGIQVLASCAANVRLNTTATAGSLDDDGTASTKSILGIALTTARAASAGLAPAILSYPTIGPTL